jgi:DNA-binding SARP family transcriptional activator
VENVADRELQFRILGPAEARGPQGERIWVRGQPLRLLGLPLVRRGEFVTADAAIEALWGDKLPAHPENALLLIVSRLGRSLGADALRWDVEGYALRLRARDSVDANRFESLVGDGEAALRAGAPVRAAELRQAASGLWRGPAVQGVASGTEGRWHRYGRSRPPAPASSTSDHGQPVAKSCA